MHPKWAKENGHQISKFKPREDLLPAALKDTEISFKSMNYNDFILSKQKSQIKSGILADDFNLLL